MGLCIMIVEEFSVLNSEVLHCSGNFGLADQVQFEHMILERSVHWGRALNDLADCGVELITGYEVDSSRVSRSADGSHLLGIALVAALGDGIRLIAESGYCN